MLKLTRGLALLTAIVLLCSAAAFPQSAGRYGLTAWAVNNQRVASQYNYDVDSIFGSGLGSYTFPQLTCQATLNLGARGPISPFASNASVKIVDITSANTETVAQTAATISGGYCTVNPTSPANAHTSYHLRSGTCGLVPAMKDLGGSGTVNVESTAISWTSTGYLSSGATPMQYAVHVRAEAL